MTQHLASVGQFPPCSVARSVGAGRPSACCVLAGITLVFVLLFDLNKIASIGSAVALLVFSMVTVAHLKLRQQTGASVIVLVVALVATLGTFLVFCGTTLADEPATATALVAILVLATSADLLWKHSRVRT